jgi:hypothetical protein
MKRASKVLEALAVTTRNAQRVSRAFFLRARRIVVRVKRRHFVAVPNATSTSTWAAETYGHAIFRKHVRSSVTIVQKINNAVSVIPIKNYPFVRRVPIRPLPREVRANS